MKYMLMMNHQGPQADFQINSWPPEDLKAHIEFMISFNQQLTDSGELVGGEGLSGPDQAKLVRANADGSPAVTDGPFPETKEVIGGFAVVDVPTREEALRWAAKIAAACRCAQEVREFMPDPNI